MIILVWKKRKIIQMQLPDYLGAPQVSYFEMFKSRDRYRVEKELGGMGIKRRKRRVKNGLMSPNQVTLDQFLSIKMKKWSGGFKLPYRQKIDFPAIPPSFRVSPEFVALQAHSCTMGYLKHLFRFNPMTFWENLPLTPAQQALYRVLSAADVFKLEMARYKRGVERFKDWIDDLNYIPGLIDAVGILPENIPDPGEYGQLVHHLGSKNINGYFLDRVQECIRYRLIDCKMVIWDGRFLGSNCAKNKNKKLKAFSDPEAGKYKHVGTFRGVGYVDSSFICAKYNLPIYYESFPGNRNDNPIFRKTFNEMMTLKLPHSEILLSDAGPYSNKSLNLVSSAGIVPLIFARKNIKKDVIKVAPRKYINISRVPPTMFPHLERLLNFRTNIERAFSPAKVVYHADRMNNRGLENSRMCIGKLKCIDLLTALTAVKVHRPDLINKPTAFRDYRPDFTVEALSQNLSGERSFDFEWMKIEAVS